MYVTSTIMFARKLPRRFTDLHRLLSAKFGKQCFFQGLLECKISSVKFNYLLHGLQVALRHVSFHLDGVQSLVSSASSRDFLNVTSPRSTSSYQSDQCLHSWRGCVVHRIVVCSKCPKYAYAETSAHSYFQGLLQCNMYYYVCKEAAKEIS